MLLWFLMLGRDYTRHDSGDLDMDDRRIDVGMQSVLLMLIMLKLSCNHVMSCGHVMPCGHVM